MLNNALFLLYFTFGIMVGYVIAFNDKLSTCETHNNKVYHPLFMSNFSKLKITTKILSQNIKLTRSHKIPK